MEFICLYSVISARKNQAIRVHRDRYFNDHNSQSACLHLNAVKAWSLESND